MKKLSLVIFMLFATVSFSSSFAKVKDSQNLNAKELYQKYQSIEGFDQNAFKADYDQLSKVQKKVFLVKVIKEYKVSKAAGNATVLEYIFAILIPPVGVGLHTNWAAKETLSNVAWTILGGIPGIIHAFVVLGRD